jgi:hypothetical protein
MLNRHPMGTTMQHPRPWLLPLPQRIICAPLSRLPGQSEQEEVDYDGQGDAQENAHKRGRAFISNTTSSETASR